MQLSRALTTCEIVRSCFHTIRRVQWNAASLSCYVFATPSFNIRQAGGFTPQALDRREQPGAEFHRADSLSILVRLALLTHNKSSAVAEMGDRGHNRHGPKGGGVLCPFRGALGTRLIQRGLRGGLYFRTKWRLHPSSRLAAIV